MPKCRDGLYCIDDLCHMTEQTLCGLWVNAAGETDDEDQEWGEEYPEEDWENDRPYWVTG